MDGTTDIPVVIGAFVTIISAFLAIAKVMLNSATKDRDAERAERLYLADAISKMATNSGKVADAAERTAEEAKQRNGHLAELIVKQTEHNEKIARQAVKQIIRVVEHKDEPPKEVTK